MRASWAIGRLTNETFRPLSSNMMATNLAGPVIGSESHLAATPNALEPRIVSGSSGLPAGFPATLNTQLAWTGEQFKNDESYIYRLSSEDIVEAETALEYFKCEFAQTLVFLRLSLMLSPTFTTSLDIPGGLKANLARPSLVFLSADY